MLRNKKLEIYLYVAGILTLMLGLIYFALNIVPLGSHSLEALDEFSAYIPQLQEIKNLLLNHRSFYHTWSRFDGSTPLTMDSLGLLFSITNWLLLFANTKILPTFFSSVILLKFILSGLAFCHLCLYKVGDKWEQSYYKKWIIVLSIVYSLNIFSAVYYTLIIWTDQLILLPFLFIAYDKLMQSILGEAKLSLKLFLLFTGLITYSVLMNFYIGYMVLLFFGILIVKDIIFNPHYWRRTVFTFIKVYSIAILIISPILLQAYKILQNNTVCDNPLVMKVIRFNPLTIFTKLLFPYYDVITDKYATPNINIGCTAVIVLIYFIRHQKLWRHKIFKANFIITLLLFISTFINPFYSIWHGLDEPNGYPCRFAFLFIGMTLYTILTGLSLDEVPDVDRSTEKVEDNNFQQVQNILYDILIYLTPILLCVVFCIAMRILNKLDYAFLAVLVTCGLIVILFINNIRLVDLFLLEHIAVFLFMFGTVVTTFDLGTVEELTEARDYIKSVTKEIKSNDSTFYRIVYTGGDVMDYNFGLSCDVNAYSAFNNLNNKRHSMFVNAISGCAVYNTITGALCTPFQQLLYGIKYDITRTGYKTYPYLSDKKIPLGFVIPDQEYPIGYKYKDPVKAQNELASLLIDNDVNLFTKIPQSSQEKTKDHTSYIYTGLNDKKTYFVVKRGFHASEIKIDTSDKKDGGPYGNAVPYNCHSVNGKLIFRLNEEDKATSSYNPKFKEYSKEDLERLDISLYQFNDEVFKELKDRLYQQPFYVDSYTDMSLYGHVVIKDSNALLYIAIPNAEYKVLIDGKPYETRESLPGFLGVNLPTGLHNVCITYISGHR